MNREGPAQVAIQNLDSKGATKIKDLECENNGNSVETIRANVKVRGGKWYYEVKLATYGKVHIGWVNEKYQTNAYNGIGMDSDSWGYDGSCQKAYHGANSSNERYGEYWNNGDIIGCVIDLEGKTISYYRNGRDLGVAFSNVQAGDGLYPAISLTKKQKVIFNFGREPFKFPLQEVFPDIHALNLQITKQQQDELNKLFEKYKSVSVNLGESSEHEDVIKSDGLLQYGADLGITDDQDPMLMIIAWKMGVNHGKCWEMTREEFVGGWSIMGATNIPEMKKRCAQWRDELKNPARFKQFYYYVFDYLKEERKILGVEEAITVWDMLGMQKRWPMMDKWLDYLKDKKAISRDTWRLFLSFTEQYSKDLSAYDADGCWPSMIDDFVEQQLGKK